MNHRSEGYSPPCKGGVAAPLKNAAKQPCDRRRRGSCEKIGIKRYSPPCITARRGGRAIQKISRSIRLSRGRGGFPMNPKGKPPRLRLLRWLRQIFFDDAATPPCGGARRGITLDSNFFTASPSAPVTVASRYFLNGRSHPSFAKEGESAPPKRSARSN